MKKLNLIGPQVGRLRYERGWSQDLLADKLQLAGWMISRGGVAKIENGLVYVPDFRLFYFASVFRVEVTVLLPKIDVRSRIHQAMSRFIHHQRLGLSDERASHFNQNYSSPQTHRRYGK